MVNEMVPIQIYVTKDMREKLKIIAKNQDRKVSNYIRRMLSKDVARAERDGLFKQF